jgi:hypothetical protein
LLLKAERQAIAGADGGPVDAGLRTFVQRHFDDLGFDHHLALNLHPRRFQIFAHLVVAPPAARAPSTCRYAD